MLKKYIDKVVGQIMKKIKKGQIGQIALVILLIMLVMLTLGISVVQRGLFDVSISQQEEETARAFQAAETGAEEALRTLAGGESSLGGDASYSVSVNSGGESGFVTQSPIETGEVLVVDLEGATSLSGVDVYFIDQGVESCSDTPPAIEVAVVEDEAGVATVSKYVYDVVDRGNNFNIASVGSYSYWDKDFCAFANIPVGADAVEMRVRPMYSRATLGIKPTPDGAVLTGQHSVIKSTGQVGAEVTRVVEVQRTKPQLPTIFDYVLFSGSDLVK